MMWNASGLNPNEGLTIAVGFNKNVIKPPAPPGYWQKKGLLFFAGAIVLLLLIYYIFTWLKYGRDPQAPTVYPLFESPNNISPAILGYVNNQYYKQELVTASIVNLAVKGYLRIEDRHDDAQDDAQRVEVNPQGTDIEITDPGAGDARDHLQCGVHHRSIILAGGFGASCAP